MLQRIGVSNAPPLNSKIRDAVAFAQPEQRMGEALATGFFNDDAYADAIIGAPDQFVGGPLSGGVRVLFGSSAGLPAVLNCGASDDSCLRLTQANVGSDNGADRFGFAVAAGDFDGDGSVSFADFLLLSSNYGKQVDAVWAEGDFNGDMVFNSSDFGHVFTSILIPSVPSRGCAPSDRHTPGSHNTVSPRVTTGKNARTPAGTRDSISTRATFRCPGPPTGFSRSPGRTVRTVMGPGVSQAVQPVRTGGSAGEVRQRNV